MKANEKVGQLSEEVERPDELDDSYAYFHSRGRPIERWDGGGGYWFVSGYDAVIAAARDDQTFSSRHDIPNGDSYLGVMVPPLPIRAIPIELDPPDHATYRHLLANRFSADSVRAMEPRIRATVRECLKGQLPLGEIDLFHDLVKVVPARTTFDLIGLPPDHAIEIADAIHAGSERFGSGVWLHVLSDLFATIAARRDTPREDLVSDLVNSKVDGELLGDEQITAICFTLITAGIHTTTKLALGALWYLGENRMARQRLIDSPELMPAAIEEFLRFYSPVSFLARTATRDVEVAGTQVRCGERVVLGWAAANRDPGQFEQPNCIDFDRNSNRHLALGIGAHYCVGAGLGRAQASIILSEVLAQLPDYEIDPSARSSERKMRPDALRATFKTPGGTAEP